MDVEIHRAIKFLQISTDLRQLQRRADVRFSFFLLIKINIKSLISNSWIQNQNSNKNQNLKENHQ